MLAKNDDAVSLTTRVVPVASKLTPTSHGPGYSTTSTSTKYYVTQVAVYASAQDSSCHTSMGLIDISGGPLNFFRVPFIGPGCAGRGLTISAYRISGRSALTYLLIIGIHIVTM